MRNLRLIWGLSLALLAAGGANAQTATQFDLVCRGTRQTGLEAEPVPIEYRIRVDLVAGRWCWDVCERTYEFADVGPDRIVFSKDEIDTYRKRSSSENSVSRSTGEHRLIWIESRPFPTYVETKGHCDPAEFSGFPAARF